MGWNGMHKQCTSFSARHVEKKCRKGFPVVVVAAVRASMSLVDGSSHIAGPQKCGLQKCGRPCIQATMKKVTQYGSV